jgi:O-antigen ligase
VAAPTTAARNRLLGEWIAWVPLVLVAFLGAVVTGDNPRLSALAAAGSFAAICLVLITVTRYETVIAAGFVVFGVVFKQPALPDLIFGIVILVGVLTGRTRLALRRSPPLIVYTLGALIVLNILSAGWAKGLPSAMFFLSITTYLALFGLWLAGYVDSTDRARKLIETLSVGAVVIASLSVLALFVPFPEAGAFLYYHRAKGLFEDPNVFGPFMIVPFAFALAELVEPRLLRWRRRTLAAILLVSAAAILFSYSRAAWLNTVLVVLTMLAIYALRRGGIVQAAKTIGLILTAAFVGLGILFASGQTSFLLERAHVQYYDAQRFQGQDESFRLARDHLIGIGPGQYANVTGYGAHETYLRALGEQGVLGLTLTAFFFLATLVFAFGNSVHGRSTFGISSPALLGLWIGLISNSFFVDTLHWRHLWLVAGLIWAGACRRERLVETTASPQAARLGLAPGYTRSSQISRQ